MRTRLYSFGYWAAPGIACAFAAKKANESQEGDLVHELQNPTVVDINAKALPITESLIGGGIDPPVSYTGPLKKVVVIGGGVCGLSTAWALAQFGLYDITLLERETIGAFSQASSINSGFLHTEPTTDPSGAEDWNSFSSSVSMAVYKYLEAIRSIEFRDTGMMLAIHTPEQLAFSKKHYPTEERADNVLHPPVLKASEPRVISPETMLNIEPLMSSELLGAVYWPLGTGAAATCHPRKAVLALAEQAREAGVKVIERAEVQDLETRENYSSTENQSPWQVSYRILEDRMDPGDNSEDVDLSADIVVLAAGSWCPHLGELAGVQIPVRPVLGMMWSTRKLIPNQVQTLIGSMESSFDWDTAPSQDAETPPRCTHRGQWQSGGRFSRRLTRHLYGKQTEEGRFIFGGDRIPHPDHKPGLVHRLPRLPGHESEQGLNMIRANKEHAGEVLPLLRDQDIERTWAGIMPFTPDGAPIIGRLDDSQSPLYCATGLGGSGFCRGPASGIILAMLINDGRLHAHIGDDDGLLPLLRHTDPNRFSIR